MASSREKENSRTGWLIILGLFFMILAQGFFAFFVVGDRGQPTWDYRPVQDVPGASPYAIHDELPYPQHVRGEKGE